MKGGESALSLMLLLVILFVGFLYLLPSILTFTRKKDNKVAILLLNIFLGWSLIGWIISLVWAVSKDTPAQQVVVQQTASTPKQSTQAPTNTIK